MPCGKNAARMHHLGNGHDDHLCMKCVYGTETQQPCISCMDGDCHFEAV